MFTKYSSVTAGAVFGRKMLFEGPRIIVTEMVNSFRDSSVLFSFFDPQSITINLSPMVNNKYFLSNYGKNKISTSI